MDYSPEIYMLWARLIIRFGLSKKEADEWVGFDIETKRFPTNVELYYLNEAYKERMREPGTPEYNLAYISRYLNNYLGGKATLEDFLPFSEAEREAMDNAKLAANLNAWAAVSNSRK